MSAKKKPTPSPDPQTVRRDRAWYYESRRGIELITQQRDVDDAFIWGDVTRIPWSKLMKSAARCGWKVQKITR